MWQERNERGVEGSPPCSECRVDLQPENEDAAEIFMLCRRQIVTAPAGEDGYFVDISIPAVKAAMDARGIPKRDQWEAMQRVRRLFYATREKSDEGEKR